MPDKKHLKKELFALFWIAFILGAMLALGVFLVQSCGSPKSGGAPAAPAPTCDGGSPIATIRQLPCPPNQTGAITQICTEQNWQQSANTCAAVPPPPPVCPKTVFTDIAPILSTHCAKCHAGIDTYAGASQGTRPAEISRRIGLPVANNDHMPVGTENPLAPADGQLIQKWVSDGTLKDCTGATPLPTHITVPYLEDAIEADLLLQAVSDRPFIEYLSTAHAFNAGDKGPWREAIDKGINSLNATKDDIFHVEPIDLAQTIWRLDVRSIGLNQADLAAIDAADGINLISNTTKGLIIRALSGKRKPWYPADTFLDIAYRNSQIYYRLLRIPATFVQFLNSIGVNQVRSLAQLDSQFIGGASSPIAEQKNRLIWRFTEDRTQQAYYWQTGDINGQPSAAKNLFQNPLLNGTGGVEIYQFDASEMIYSLPNGLQGYAIFSGAGNRLDAAPPDVVRDTRSPITSVISLFSCSGCHQQGLIPMIDEVRVHVIANAAQFNANDVELVKKLYLQDNSQIFKRDNRIFGSALAKINVDPNKPDPQAIISDRYLLNWDLNKVASFLLLTPAEGRACINQSATGKRDMGQLLLSDTAVVTFATFQSVLPALIADCRLFQDPVGQ
jgi:hypothetical protein